MSYMELNSNNGNPLGFWIFTQNERKLFEQMLGRSHHAANLDLDLTVAEMECVASKINMPIVDHIPSVH